MAVLVRDDPDLQKELARRVQDAKPAFGGMLVRALAQSGSTAAATGLTYSLGRDPRLDLCLADALGALAEGAAGTLSETALQALRAQLGSTDPRAVCASATALGRLGDEASVEKLVQLLGDPDAMKKHGALMALCALSGRDRTGEQKEWEAWLEGENKWTTERLPGLERVIAEGGWAVRVLAELSPTGSSAIGSRWTDADARGQESDVVGSRAVCPLGWRSVVRPSRPRPGADRDSPVRSRGLDRAPADGRGF
jgi:hypothetical protein